MKVKAIHVEDGLLILFVFLLFIQLILHMIMEYLHYEVIYLILDLILPVDLIQIYMDLIVEVILVYIMQYPQLIDFNLAWILEMLLM